MESGGPRHSDASHPKHKVLAKEVHSGGSLTNQNSSGGRLDARSKRRGSGGTWGSTPERREACLHSTEGLPGKHTVVSGGLEQTSRSLRAIMRGLHSGKSF